MLCGAMMIWLVISGSPPLFWPVNIKIIVYVPRISHYILLVSGINQPLPFSSGSGPISRSMRSSTTLTETRTAN